MDKIDTHQVELAFDELISELGKLKDLNNLVDSYKDTVDVLKQRVSELVEHLESFYKSAKEHDLKVNELYNQYVCKSDEIIKVIDKRILEQERVNRRVSLINTVILIISSLSFLGVFYLIFAK